jgi:hypothetical protein
MPSGSLEGIRLGKDRFASIKHRKTFEGSKEG